MVEKMKHHGKNIVNHIVNEATNLALIRKQGQKVSKKIKHS